ncbi:ABC transporter substrate-binding protein [Flavilitoribacter nigricans]|uniref:Solute-binding protein family 5 domain-containing protein n=1 Tax=Flavilitoribacter nigricans (strain ATCC 23147 / DSM 23189 / NBRC 102662 / NCIMB 1420 / SS-2) TaxID=1122177 RepID=A0A2D0NFA3_FLAN2|nr:ABC transporter substrate-binding protein [Flavilitoribacter nigricans]PHN07165.1 hypothetical protein CRP01_08035 [Flavilitoribacter nigricans DSM 23189 = NBRC 102662]
MRSDTPYGRLLLTFGLLLALVSCNNDSTVADDSCQRTGNELIIRQQVEPDRLNPLLTSSGYANQINQLIFLTLETLDPENLELAPMLIKQRPAVETTESGGMRFTFDILEEASWDDGSPITAHDYVFTVKTSLHPGLNADRYRPYIGIISSIDIDPDNPKHFTVTTRDQDQLGEEFVSNVLMIMPEYHYDPNGLLRDIPLEAFADEAQLKAHTTALEDFAAQFSDQRLSREADGVIGGGPYRLESWETGQRVNLVKKDNWWGEDLVDDYPALDAYPDRISFQLVADGATAVAVVQGEEIDMVPELDVESFVRLENDSLVQACYNMESFPQLVRSFLSLNTRSPKLADKRVRRAIALSIDVEEVIRDLYQGFGDRINGPVPPSVAFANKKLALLDYDPEQAKNLLTEAGWEDTNGNGTVDKTINGTLTEMELSFEIPAGRESTQQLGLLLKEQMQAAGIGLEIEPGDWNEIMGRHRSGDFEIVPMGRTFPSPTVWNPRQNYHSQGDNRTGFGNAETDALIDRILTTFDERERYDLYRELQGIIYEEQPEIFLFAPRARIAIHKRFETPLIPIAPGFLPNLVKLK